MKVYQLIDMTGCPIHNYLFLTKEAAEKSQIELSDKGFDAFVRVREVLDVDSTPTIDMQEIRNEVLDLKDWGHNEIELRKHFHAKYSRTLDIITDIFNK